MITIQDINEARTAIGNKIKHTPLVRSRTFSEMTECKLHLKLENLQATGSFKIRGALNKISGLSESERAKGLVCASAGNHAQGVAFAASSMGVPSTVYVPLFAPPAKVLATQGYGATVKFEGLTYDDAYNAASKAVKEEGLTYVHAFDDDAVIAGQGTIGLELIDDLDEIDVVLIPIGGGGLAAGIAIAIHSRFPKAKIIGVEAEGAASMKLSYEAKSLKSLVSMNTICDGIAVKSPGKRNYEILQKHLDDVIAVSDEETANALFLMAQRAKLIAEPAGAVTLAALLSKKVKVANKNVAAIISGGNIDLALLSQIADRGLLDSGMRARMSLNIQDKPGELDQLLDILTSLRTNIETIDHDRQTSTIPIGHVRVTITFRTLGPQQIPIIGKGLEQRGYKYEIHS